ncbi:MAG: polysaccharide pyruvyl transferase family protein [Bifidobacteriaceae bacterium]|nr:polysaccharide pyruvyl transferase family protein [Bifidobacteriaceae bacterium]MCI1915207.1 polysaccharide pyruvyl transferase family protein [Bifidobacteriaceae bacterium]
MDRIYLVSAGGFPNYGDEFITLAWLRFLAKQRPDTEVWVDCLNPGHAELMFRDKHPNVHFVNTLWQLIKDVNKKEKTPQGAQRYLTQLVHHSGESREVFGIELLKTVKSIHFLGGGYINNVWRDHYLLVQLAAALKQMHPQIGLYGTGLGLYPQGNEMLPFVRESLAKFDHLSVRDHDSADIAGTDLGYDDAFLGLNDEFKDEFFDDRPQSSARAFVSLQQDVVGRNEAAIPKIAEMLIASGIEPDEPIQVFEAMVPDDGWSVRKLQESWFGKVSLLPFTQIWEKGFPRAEGAVWVSSRFHMHLLAAAQGMRGVGLVFDNQYYQNKHQSLFELGTGWAKFAENSRQATTASLNEEFPQKAADIAEKKIEEARGLYTASV